MTTPSDRNASPLGNLLSKEPTEDELLDAKEVIKHIGPIRDWTELMIENGIRMRGEYFAKRRHRIVRATAEACAKLVCHGCRNDVKFSPVNLDYHRPLDGDPFECLAAPIHQTLAASGGEEK